MNSELSQDNLDFLKMTAKYVTMVVRNSIEDFHAKYIPQDEMKDFNTTVRMPSLLPYMQNRTGPMAD